MKNLSLLAGLALLVSCSTQKATQSTSTAVVAPPKNLQDSLSYAYGITTATSIKNQGLDKPNYDLFMKAMKDVYNQSSQLSNEQAQAFLKEVNSKKAASEGEANRKAGEAFLAANKSKPGVITLPSGLQYKILTKGKGTQKPTLTDKVKTHYHGTLIDGTVFDSSVDRGQPISFPVNGVIRGWVEILQLMVPGDKFEIYVPYDLAYNARATGKIKAYSALIFTVELIDIEKP